jgi:tellurium resistance protein TerD
MALTLVKGEVRSLTQDNPELKTLLIGLGWDPADEEGVEFDIDVSLFILGEDGKVRGSFDFICYNQTESICRSVQHTGDNRDGQGDGDDESIICNLQNLESTIKKLAIVVTIHEAQARKQNFGQVDNVFIRIEDNDTGKELLRYDLNEDFSIETALLVAEIYRGRDNEWKFRAVGRGYQASLGMFADKYGVILEES